MELFHIIGNWALSPYFLARRMSFIAGPRQVGKTTLALMHLKKLGQEKNYYNWDTLGVKRLFALNPLFFLENIPEPPPPPRPTTEPRHWVIFDEFHKHIKWKEFLKGYFDEFAHFIRFVVCGSARLDIYRRTGESLIGRYFLFKMLPLGPRDVTEGERFSLQKCWRPGEPLDIEASSMEFMEATEKLYHISGFPEPFLVGREDFYRRWKEEHISILTTEEVRDLSKISDLVRLHTLVFLLPERMGSPLSLNNLSQALGCAYNTVKVWIEALEKVYLIFQVLPFTGKLSRSIKKEKKVYFWDWGLLEDEGKRFENFLAVQLMRAVSAWNEWGWGRFDLYYVRTKDGKETDFLISREGVPLILIEAKFSEITPDPSLFYFKERLGAELAFQVVWNQNLMKQVASGVFVLDIFRFLKLLV